MSRPRPGPCQCVREQGRSPRGHGPPGAGVVPGTEERSINMCEQIRDGQGGVGSALERRQQGTRQHGGLCHQGGKCSASCGPPGGISPGGRRGSSYLCPKLFSSPSPTQGMFSPAHIPYPPPPGQGKLSPAAFLQVRKARWVLDTAQPPTHGPGHPWLHLLHGIRPTVHGRCC